jgi:EAL domain-containing protein (putative c-di-GMP-specific phosphodiesterase class I)
MTPVSSTGTMLDTLLAPGALTTLFQPIVHEPSRRVHAFECLTRGPVGTNFHSADVLFEYARRKGAEGILDRACASQALVTAARELPSTADVAINIHASTLGRDTGFARDLQRLAQSCGFASTRVIVEIVEQAPVLNHRDFLASLANLRAAGFRIALDDVGVGYSNFKMMIDCAPDYLKIERQFTSGAENDPPRSAVIESVAGFARRVGARVVAEGVEEESERAFLTTLGITLMQGYLYARPMSAEAASRYMNDTAEPDQPHNGC